MSGQLLSTTDSTGGKGSTGKPVSPHFTSDNNIDSGVIAPGQHYQLHLATLVLHKFLILHLHG